MIRILSDSTCDLGGELAARFDVRLLPLHVLLDEEDYLDGVNITPEQIFAWSEQTRKAPKTAAPSVDEAKKILKEGLDAGDEWVCFTISSEMSASFSVLQLAAKQLHAADRIRVVDSRNLSTGIGLQVLQACDDVKRGLSAEEICAHARETADRIRASFIVDTLEYLHRGGRCGGLSAMMGSVLRIHPKIVVENGVMRPDRKYRGPLDNVIAHYVRDLDGEMRSGPGGRVFITHSGCSPQIVDQVRSSLSALGCFGEVIETRAGGVISCHCGPGTLGVLFIGK